MVPPVRRRTPPASPDAIRVHSVAKRRPHRKARPIQEETPMHKPLAAAFAACAALVAGLALAQSYPVKPVKLIVTYPPGGSSDLLARVFGQKLSEVWGQPVIVESKPGADRKSTRLNSSHQIISYAVFCLK